MSAPTVLDFIDRWLTTGADPAALSAYAHTRPDLADALYRLAEVVFGNVAPGPEISKANLPARYQYERELGAGGFARVILAKDTSLNRLVAIKCVHAAGRLDANVYLRFVREARIHSRCMHPNITALFGVDAHGGHPYLVTEYVAGRTLLDYLLARGPLAPNAAARVLAEVAAAVGYIHNFPDGVIHRDLSPKNVMLVEPESEPSQPAAGLPIPRVKLIDFGLCKVLSSGSAPLTASAAFVGTPGYAAPEQFAFDRPSDKPDKRSDVYSLGALLFDILAGLQPPTVAETGVRAIGIARGSTSYQKAKARGRLPEGVRVSTDLKKICETCLRRDPRERFYPDALALHDDLMAFLEGRAPTVRSVTRWVKFGYWVRRNKPLSAAMFVGIAAGGAALYQRDQSLVARAGEAEANGKKLVAESERADANEKKAVAERERGEEAQRRSDEAQTFAVDLLVSAGIRTLRPDRPFADGDPFTSLLYFAKAAERDGGHPTRGPTHATRLSTLASQLPALSGLVVFDRRPDVTVLSPDGRRLAAFAGGRGRVWDVATGDPVGEEFAGVGGAFGRNANHFIRYGTVVDTIDYTTGRSVTPDIGPLSPTSVAAVNADGTRVAVADAPGRVTVWDVSAGVRVSTLTHRSAKVSRVEFSPDRAGAYLVLGSPADLRTDYTLWETVSGRRVDLSKASKREGELPVYQLAFSPDGEWLVTAARPPLGGQNVVRLWEVKGMRANELSPLASPEVVTQEMTGIAVSAGRRRMAVALGPVGSKVVLFDPVTPVQFENWFDLEAREVDLVNPFWDCAFSPTGDTLVTVTRKGQPIIWEAESGRRLTPRFPGAERVRTTWTPPLSALATAGEDGVTRVWAFRDRHSPVVSLDHPDPVAVATFTPDGTGVISGGAGGTVRRWNLRSHEIVREAKGHTGEVWGASLTSNGQRLTTAGQDGQIRFWSPELQPVGETIRYDGPIQHAAVSPDGTLTLGLSYPSGKGVGPSATVWRTADGEKLWSKQGRASEPYHAVFSPDSRRVLLVGDTATIYDAVSGERQGEPMPETKDVSDAAWSPDGRQVATACRDNTARLWSPTATDPVKILPHDTAVKRVAFTPDGKTLVTASRFAWNKGVPGCRVRLWTADTGQPITSPVGIGEAEVSGLAVSPDGRWVVVGCGERGESRMTRRGTVAVLDARTLLPVILPVRQDAWATPPRFSPDGNRLLWLNRDARENVLSVMDLTADTRPADVRIAWAELLAGQRLDGTSALVPLTPAELKSLWHAVPWPR